MHASSGFGSTHKESRRACYSFRTDSNRMSHAETTARLIATPQFAIVIAASVNMHYEESATGASATMSGSDQIWQKLHNRLARQLAGQGFTITHPFSVQLFNAQGCPPEHQLPTFGRASTLGIVIGNTSALWPKFIQHLATDPDTLLAESDPLDAFVHSTISAAVKHCCCQDPVTKAMQHTTTATPCLQQETPSTEPAAEQHPETKSTSVLQPEGISTNSVTSTSDKGGPRFALRFSHHTEPGRFVNMMRAAQLSGLAYYSDTTHLCMHPVYGPWFALRAVAVVDTEGPNISTFSPLPCPHPDLEAAAAQQMQRLEELGGFTNWQQHWRDWAALRALGAKYTDPRFAYSDDQLEYHYTKNKDVLWRAVAALQQQEQER